MSLKQFLLVVSSFFQRDASKSGLNIKTSQIKIMIVTENIVTKIKRIFHSIFISIKWRQNKVCMPS